MVNGDWKPAAIERTKELFNPRNPISQKKFLAGRSVEISRLIGAIQDPGAHVIVFGDRGVGKSSVASCIEDVILATPGIDIEGLACIRVNCATNDTYTAIWQKVFGKIFIDEVRETIGFSSEEVARSHPLADNLGEEVLVHEVQALLKTCGEQHKLVVILDEFDRLENDVVRKLLADTIKALADFSVPVTLVIVGVGESVSQLIKDHGSLGRHLVEVPVPRLQPAESVSIFVDRLPELSMTIDEHVRGTIIFLSKGLPFYVHLLGRHGIINAIEAGSSRVEKEHMWKAFKDAVENSKQALKSVYYNATLSNQTRSLHRQCLAACAIAPTDFYGYFTAASIVEPISRILGRQCSAGTFSERLTEFCAKERGYILQRKGKPRSWRYRFTDPLMEPFVLLSALDENLITTEMIGG